MGKTTAQKIFDAHVVDKPADGVWVLSLDRVFCHEITTPIASVARAAKPSGVGNAKAAFWNRENSDPSTSPRIAK